VGRPTPDYGRGAPFIRATGSRAYPGIAVSTSRTQYDVP
jgi:hypothetical protein